MSAVIEIWEVRKVRDELAAAIHQFRTAGNQQEVMAAIKRLGVAQEAVAQQQADEKARGK